jgi:hypothetical protein
MLPMILILAPRAKRRRKTNKSDRVIGDQDLDAFVADTAVDENAGPAMDLGMDFDFGMDVGMDMGIVGGAQCLFRY